MEIETALPFTLRDLEVAMAVLRSVLRDFEGLEPAHRQGHWALVHVAAASLQRITARPNPPMVGPSAPPGAACPTAARLRFTPSPRRSGGRGVPPGPVPG